MTWIEFLAERRETIVDRWIRLTMETYPEETLPTLSKVKDQFANPMGYAIRQGIGGLFDALVAGGDEEAVMKGADRIVRLRAVQDFSPSRAVGFVFLLKNIIDEFESEADKQGVDKASQKGLERQIDMIALAVFDAYMACREKVWEVRANELRDRTQKFLARYNVAVSEYVTKPNPDDNGT